MNRELPVIPSLIFIASLIICIAIYMQRVTTFSVPLVGQFFKHSSSISLLFGNRVLSLNDGVKPYTLERVGVHNHVGQLGVGEDGSLFVNIGGQSASLKQKWDRFKRLKENNPKGGKSSVLKCIDIDRCQSWGESTLQFDTAWSMFSIGEGLFIVNDTARHQVHLVNQDGKILDTQKGFHFPNHVFQRADSNWVVNTNTNSFIEVAESHGSLERTGEEIKLVDYKGIPNSYRFPSIAYSAKDKSVIVLTHPNGMNQGRVFQLNNGRATPLFEELNDITSIFVDGNVVYAADYETNTLWQLDLTDGFPSQLVNSDYSYALTSEQAAASESWWAFIKLATFIIFLGGMALVYAIAKSTLPQNIEVQLDRSLNSLENLHGKLVWVEQDKNYAKLIRRIENQGKYISIGLSVVLVALFALGIIFYNLGDEPIKKFLPLVGYIILLFFLVWLIFFMVQRLQRRRIGWDGELIHFKNHIGQKKVRPEQVFYSQFEIYTKGKGFNIQIQQYARRFLDKRSFETLISPVLLPENKLSTFKLFVLKLQDKDSETLMQLTLGGMGVILLLCL